jgi:predicted nucleic acid-binding protein
MNFKKLPENIVLDASVIFKIIYPESGSNIADKIIEFAIERSFTIWEPPEWELEIMHILRHHPYSFTQKQAEKKIDQLKQLGFRSTELNDRIIAKASNILFKYSKIYILDCIYHALAIEKAGYLITADKKYFDLVKNEGKIILLSDINI